MKYFYNTKQSLLKDYMANDNSTHVAGLISRLNLDEAGKATMQKILDGALTDAFYTVLLGLDGVANIGRSQQLYKLYDEDNNELTGGHIEVYAWEYFHGNGS